MVTKIIDGQLYKEMIINATSNLKLNAKIVNDLNVFPVPDGDTGDNMQMTMEGGASAVNNIYESSISIVANEVAKGMFLGARGNSGVILSQFFEGVSKGLKDYETVDAIQFVNALKSGVKQAYSAVVNPVEGTILTVMNDATVYTRKMIDDTTTINKLFEFFLEEMQRSLERTPSLLPALKDAGVVDSGGAGFSYIVDGMFKTLTGEKIESNFNFEAKSTPKTGKFDADSELEFGYCTEFLLQLQNSKVNCKNFDINIIIDFLKEIGDSIVAFKNNDIVKVHVHTKTPGKVIEFVQKFGEFLTFKLENMSLQHSEATIQNNYKPKERKKFAIVSVASGEGIINTFLNYGADAIVEGGQTMNPSVEDFIKIFDSLNAENIIVLPNNSNIILTAKQASSNYEKAKIHVVNTTSIAQGYSALSMLDLSSEDSQTIIEILESAISNVKEGSITYAVRDANIEGVEIKKNDYMAMIGKKILTSTKDKVEACLNLIDYLDEEKEAEVITIIYGNDVSEKELEEVSNKISLSHPDAEIYPIEGNHEVYSFIIVVE